MKKSLIILFINLCFASYSQDYKDRIITLKNDTIVCKIIEINPYNILYKAKDLSNESQTILLNHVSKYILRTDSSNELSFTVPVKEKYLIIESTKFTDWQSQPERVIYKTGDKVTVYNNEIGITGKIDSILDSAIFINGRKIKTTEMRRIFLVTRRGKTATIIGLSTSIISIGMIYLNGLFYPEKYNDEDEDINSDLNFYYSVTFGCIALTGGVVAIVGIIEMITVKHYNTNKKWKIYTSS
jgi:hypothetical protein